MLRPLEQLLQFQVNYRITRDGKRMLLNYLS
jgi:hypothetical protein